MGNGRCRRVDDQFADGLGAERPVRFIARFKFDVDLAQVHARRHTVLHEGVILQAARRRILDIFGQGHADGLDDAPFGLDFGQGRIDDRTAVDDGVILHQGDVPRFRVDVDRCRTGHIRRRTGRRITRFCRFQGDVIHEHGVIAQVLEGDFLASRQVSNGFAVEFQIVNVSCAELDSCPFFHALYQALAGLDDGIAREVCRRRRIGSAVVRRCIRIDAISNDIVDRAHETFRGNLGQDGIAARPHIGSSDIE